VRINHQACRVVEAAAHTWCFAYTCRPASNHQVCAACCW
jgi:hypothetical protein